MRCLFLFLLLVGLAPVLAQNPRPVYGVSMPRDARWPAQPDGRTIINVSWENPSPTNEQEREWVRKAIEETWEKVTRIDFVGWGPATPSSQGIRILIDGRAWPHVVSLGQHLNGTREGMVLNFDFLGDYKCIRSRAECIRFIAVHEFGHAIGLAHEHNRPDCLCGEPPQGTNADVFITPCDLESVMNYCNPKWNNHGKLSRYDIIGSQLVYGSPQAITNQVYLDSLKLVPATPILSDKATTIQTLVSRSTTFHVSTFLQETEPVRQKAVDRLPNLITIRYFAAQDEIKARNIEQFLVAQGYPDRLMATEDMRPYYSGRTIPNYIEVWLKEDTTPAVVSSLDEIRLVPATADNVGDVASIKSAIDASNSFSVKIYTEEKNLPVSQHAIDRLTNPVTIRFFHPDDEVKANRLKKLLVSKGLDMATVSIENMLPFMSRVYPNYIEIWQK